jgi:hypothetical protein
MLTCTQTTPDANRWRAPSPSLCPDGTNVQEQPFRLSDRDDVDQVLDPDEVCGVARVRVGCGDWLAVTGLTYADIGI